MKWLLPFGLLALTAISTEILADDADWWKTITLYQIYPRSFKDSDGDGIGDLPGITSKLEYFVDAGIEAIWISPIYPSPMIDFGYDISNFLDIEPMFGTMKDFEALLAKAKSLGLKVLLDFVPNHTSDQHEWFVKSLAGIEPYKDYYVWHNGTKLANGTIVPPNNWRSVFSVSAWTWRDERQAYYLHQFAVQQPDLNFRNENVVKEMEEVLRFWLDKGVNGFRVDATNFLVEDALFRDEELIGDDPRLSKSYNHNYTMNQPECFELVKVWRKFLDNYTLHSDNITRPMMTEAYGNITLTMKYFEYGSHVAFNFYLILRLNSSSSAANFKDTIDTWMVNMPTNGIANWQFGNHDRRRVATRYGSERANGMMMLVLFLPGVGIIYNGDEIGMEDKWISWEDTVDPQACNTNREIYESQTRDPGRTPFQWDDTTSAGFSTNARTWLPVNDNYVSLNLAAQKAADESYYKVFQRMTALRKLPVLKKGSVNTLVLSDNVLAISRELTGYDRVILLINFVGETTIVSLKVFESVPDVLYVCATSVNSALTIGSEVFTFKLALPSYAAVVLTTKPCSS